MSTTLYTRLLELLPSQPILRADVEMVNADGTALVRHTSGAQAIVRNPLGLQVGRPVYVQNGAVIGDAPDLPYVLIEI